MLARLLIASMVFSLTSTGIVANAESFSMNDTSSIESTEIASEKMPAEEEPSEDMPAEEEPSEEVPPEEEPSEEMSAEEEPSEEVPAEEEPSEEVPVEGNINKLVSMNDGSFIECTEMPSEEMPVEEVEEITANKLDRTYTGKDYVLQEGASTYSNDINAVDNTDPNYAYLVTNDTTMQGTIGAANEMRWYGFVLNESSKVTILLQMVESLDADLYMFALNADTYNLELIGGSAVAGLGHYEYFSQVMGAGTYYFAVGGYEGSGAYSFSFYQSTADVAYEINDTLEDATKITFNSNVIGVIDHPNDCDYYKFTATSKTIFRYSITSSDGYSLLYAGNSGSGAVIYTFKDAYMCEPGTYYFAVLSENNKYSASSTYTINFNKVASFSNDSSLIYSWVSLGAGIVFQSNSDGTRNYVNGNYIDYEYSYHDEMTNSAGTQFYDISIDTNAGAFVRLDEYYGPGLAHYISSTRPYRKVSSRPVLILTYYSDTVDFYKIHCRGTGAYSMNTFWDETNYVTVVIDPQSGNLIDISEPNYYYQLITVGDNEITMTASYRWESQ